jgi:hypothetical protein
MYQVNTIECGIIETTGDMVEGSEEGCRIDTVAVQRQTAGPKLRSGHLPLIDGPIPSRIGLL